MTRFPPPLIAGIGILTIYSLNRVFPQYHSESLGSGLTTSIFFGLGVVLLLWAMKTFRAHKTTVNPMQPEQASTLVTTGPYKLMRNPMYLALVLFLWAAFTYVGNWLGLGVVIICLLYFDTVQIAAEEKALSEKFGEEWTAYSNKVRKWI